MKLITGELNNYLFLLVLLKSPILIFMYFKFITKSSTKKDLISRDKSNPKNIRISNKSE